MTELQQVEFDLFRIFAETCEKLNLNYFLVCGSALGAKRHGGFIPWDDDLDVGMYREDYNKFIELAPPLLPEGIFLQNYHSDPEYRNIFSKLRNSNTTYIEKTVQHLNINHGIYIDVFPLDGYPQSALEQKWLAFEMKYYVYALLSGFSKSTSLKGTLANLPFRMLGYPRRVKQTLMKYESVISKYPIKDTKLVCNHGTWYGKRNYIPKEFYGKGSVISFEGYPAKVPEDIENYLKTLFGDWQTPPPPEKQRGHHFYEICDTKKPYTEYLN